MGQIGFSQLVFKESGSAENVETWAVMISGFAQNQSFGSAFELLEMMIREGLRPNTSCWSSVLSIIDCIYVGRQTHCYILKNGMVSDICVGSALFTMYSKCGSLEEAYVVSNKYMTETEFHGLQCLPGNVLYFHPCKKARKFMHMLFVQNLGGDTLVSGGLVTMYSKCGVLVSARRVFELMPQKDKVSWSSLISGYAQNGYVEKALLQYHEMLVADPPVGNSFITIYSKCGSIEDSNKVFDQIEHPNLIAWSSMIMGYAQHGKGMDDLRLYDLMRSKGLEPDPLTFVGVLSACSHSGLVEEGYIYFNSMTKIHGIKPGSHHYACMVDILGQQNTLELQPTEVGAYVSLSNILADMGQWNEFANIRNLMRGGVGAKKKPGWSSL
ncbi:Pentatricopeptide repeat-containing protein [Thalictrum thalictroides]|uniref:Pentatricopeptide repeat-containing protein n=1 Tax=Thalictrum thalictroides TaxID=46969 RepID=A0A7J6VHN6_THATH|nr:Pentatricopeptide repeat-containing protein [Thalictrum thalictroides]